MDELLLWNYSLNPAKFFEEWSMFSKTISKTKESDFSFNDKEINFYSSSSHKIQT
jgi:hypothetical protein